MTDEKKDDEMYRCEDCGYTGPYDDFDTCDYTLAYYVGDRIVERHYDGLHCPLCNGEVIDIGTKEDLERDELL